MILDDSKLKLRRVTAKVRNEWPIEKRIECVSKYLVLGNLSLVAQLTGVSIATLEVWKKQPWWADLTNEVKATRRVQQDSKLSQIVDRALDTIADRLENGEHVYDQKTGQIVRKPVALRDANVTANTLMQRQAILEKLHREDNSNKETKTIQEQLTFLANEFAKFNKRQNSLATTVEYKEIEDDAVHEEWEEGLQEGSEGIHQPTGSSEETDRAERSAA